MGRLILGINSAHGDSSAALVTEKGIVAAIAEERINRRKHCAGFPSLAVGEVLRIAGASVADLTDIAVARDSKANLAAKLAFVARHPAAGIPRAVARLKVHQEVGGSPAAVAEALGVQASVVKARFHHVEHHLAHIASSFFCSRFDRATGISIDGAGDFASHMLAACSGLDVEPIGRTLWPHSAGVFYTAVCQFLGFDKFGEEYKVMGLAAYGVNRYANEMAELIRYSRSRGLRLNLRYYRHHRYGLQFEQVEGDAVTVPQLWHERMTELFGPARRREDPIGDRERDVAASLQLRFEEIYLSMIRDGIRRVGCRDVVLAGGSALNSVGNGRMITERICDRAYFHPAASDDGTAAGAALHVLHAVHRAPRTGEMRHAFLGTEQSEEQIEQALKSFDVSYEKLPYDVLIARAADTLAEGKIVGWYQGREEWGPRALGNRSILCHPGWPGMKDTLNARIKHREPFRPFAPVVLEDKLDVCFRGDHEVPFMIVVYKVRPEWKERLSAITHEDGTGRVQTIGKDQNKPYYDVLRAFDERTGIPVLLNTSFNENEPIVHTPEQAIDCYLRTKMDGLGIGPFWLSK